MGKKTLTMSGGAQLSLTDKSGNLSNSIPRIRRLTGFDHQRRYDQQHGQPMLVIRTCKASQGACASVDPYPRAFIVAHGRLVFHRFLNQHGEIHHQMVAPGKLRSRFSSTTHGHPLDLVRRPLCHHRNAFAPKVS